MNSNEMRQKFYKALSDLLKNKREDNKSFLNKEEYMLRLQEVKLAKEKIGKKSAKDYRYIRKYDIITLNGQERLIKSISNNSENVHYYVSNDELFDILHDSHIAIGHGGRDRMVYELKTKYSNITKETIMIYLSLCMHCARCHCKTKCKTNKCTCRSNNRLCTSKCHNSLSCENK